jgi:FAD dependent oxidoreductase
MQGSIPAACRAAHPQRSRVLALGALLLAACATGPGEATPSAAPIACEILILGGSFGGCAAALGAQGRDVWVVEDSDWIGGQVTSQGVSALDEHAHIESFGGTRVYEQFRVDVRARSGGASNPGGGWVSRLCFLPRIGLDVLESMLADGPRILRGARAIEAVTEDACIVSVTVRDRSGKRLEFRPRFVLEATDAGDFLPLCGAPFRQGAESRAETAEPHAADLADPRRQQSFTWCFAVEYRPGENHTIERPLGYERFRDTQPYSLSLPYPDGSRRRYGFFEKGEGFGPFWTYRRIAREPDVALINWPGNDYRGTPLLDPDHDEARRLSLGFLHWLQTECPRDDGGSGYPELMLRPDVMGTPDGLAMRPYVREGRRLRALGSVVEQDLTLDTARALAMPDAVGLGWYPIDVHTCAGDVEERGGLAIPTRPFQIPLAAMLAEAPENLIAAGKCFGATHVTNGAFRLHPIEWNIGESAGQLASFCLAHGVSPRDVLEQTGWRRAFQVALLEAGIPLHWFIDLRREDPLWAAAQALAVWGELEADPRDLRLGATPEQRAAWLARYRALCDELPGRARD